MSGRATTACARTLVDELARGGVRHAALAPGSRSTPVALALADHAGIRLEVFHDERSAAFFALGAAAASGVPAAVLCTSGTAAAHFHPAVLEAAHGRVPLLALTADRPPELRDTGAPQTIDQVKLYGDAVRWACDVGVPEEGPDAPRYWRSVAARAVAEASGPPAGPVQMNLPFREPLVPPSEPVATDPGRADAAPWQAHTRRRPRADPEVVTRVAERVVAAERGLLVCGWERGLDPGAVERLAAAAGWPLLADAISGSRSCAHAVSTYEALLRAPGFAAAHRPDLVVRMGAPLTSKVATQWLDPSVPQVLIDPDGAALDPGRAAAERVAADPNDLLQELCRALGRRPETPWLAGWLRAEAGARRALDNLLDGWDEPFEGRVARDVWDLLPEGNALFVASSMPVRDLEAFARPRSGVRVHANRGVNGIDGVPSTVLGLAAGYGTPVTALVGDLAFLHDQNGLVGAARRGLDATFVVLDNDGGGIFSFLPQAEAVPERFEALFGTPHGLDLGALAEVHGLPWQRVTTAAGLRPALERAWAAGGVQVVLVPTDRAANVARHREVWAAVAVALAR